MRTFSLHALEVVVEVPGATVALSVHGDEKADVDELLELVALLRRLAEPDVEPPPSLEGLEGLAARMRGNLDDLARSGGWGRSAEDIAANEEMSRVSWDQAEADRVRRSGGLREPSGGSAGDVFDDLRAEAVGDLADAAHAHAPGTGRGSTTTPCEWCGKAINNRGLKNHERSCAPKIGRGPVDQDRARAAEAL